MSISIHTKYLYIQSYNISSLIRSLGFRFTLHRSLFNDIRYLQSGVFLSFIVEHMQMWMTGSR